MASSRKSKRSPEAVKETPPRRLYGIYVCAPSYDWAWKIMHDAGYGVMDFTYVCGANTLRRLRGMTLINLGGNPEIAEAALERGFTVLDTPERRKR